MTSTKSGQALLEAARNISSERRELNRQIRYAVLLERERIAHANYTDQKKIAEWMLGGTGIDLASFQARKQQESNAPRAFLEEQRRIIEKYLQSPSGKLSRHLRRTPPYLPFPESSAGRAVTLDTAIFIGPSVDRTSNDRFYSLWQTVTSEPPAPMHNVAKADIRLDAHEPFDFPNTFNFPPDNEVNIDFFFSWTADSDVTFNALSFVQPNGIYYAFSQFYPFLDSRASVGFVAGLDIFVFDPSGTLILVSNGTRDARLELSVFTSGWFGSSDGASGYYNDMSEVSDFGVNAATGNIVLINVWAYLNAPARTYASAEFDFQSSDAFGIEVPAVWLFTQSIG